MDAHYTPAVIAASLLEGVRHLSPKVIADLAAGDGQLLLEAERLWPDATFVATDIDYTAVRRLRKCRPNWQVGRCDLRSKRSRASCRPLQVTHGSISLLLLNPPFTCRGGTRYSVPTDSGPLEASTAMSFLLHATIPLSNQAHIVCILPFGCLTNIKDEPAWRYLRSKYTTNVLACFQRGTFPESTARTALVLFSPMPPNSCPQQPSSTDRPPDCVLRVRVARGACQVHRLPPATDGPPLAHYTDLHDGLVKLSGRRGAGPHKRVVGPAVLIPRVGRLTADKVGLLAPGLEVMLSDCVIALTPRPPHEPHLLRRLLLARLPTLKSYYGGTGAPFISLTSLKAALNEMNIDVE